MILDNDPGDEQPGSSLSERSYLEQLIDFEANKELKKSLNYSKGQYNYFIEARTEVEQEFFNRHQTHKNITNYLIDSYIFHRRHKELSKDESTQEMYRDTIRYLLRLKNDFPLENRYMRDI